jgi:hypothetical protein
MHHNLQAVITTKVCCVVFCEGYYFYIYSGSSIVASYTPTLTTVSDFFKNLKGEEKRTEKGIFMFLPITKITNK